MDAQLHNIGCSTTWSCCMFIILFSWEYFLNSVLNLLFWSCLGLKTAVVSIWWGTRQRPRWRCFVKQACRSTVTRRRWSIKEVRRPFVMGRRCSMKQAHRPSPTRWRCSINESHYPSVMRQRCTMKQAHRPSVTRLRCSTKEARLPSITRRWSSIKETCRPSAYGTWWMGQYGSDLLGP